MATTLSLIIHCTYQYCQDIIRLALRWYFLPERPMILNMDHMIFERLKSITHVYTMFMEEENRYTWLPSLYIKIQGVKKSAHWVLKIQCSCMHWVLKIQCPLSVSIHWVSKILCPLCVENSMSHWVLKFNVENSIPSGCQHSLGVENSMPIACWKFSTQWVLKIQFPLGVSIHWVLKIQYPNSTPTGCWNLMLKIQCPLGLKNSMSTGLWKFSVYTTPTQYPTMGTEFFNAHCHCSLKIQCLVGVEISVPVSVEILVPGECWKFSALWVV